MITISASNSQCH